MSWVRVDDTAPQHPKFLLAGAEACWLWTAGCCYSNAHTLDGRLPKALLASIYPPLASKSAKLAKVLCEVRLWHDRGDHYEIHDYAVYQSYSLKENKEARQSYERDRKAAQREKKRLEELSRTSPGQSPACPTGVPPAAPGMGWDGMGTSQHEEREKLAVDSDAERAAQALVRLKAVR